MNGSSARVPDFGPISVNLQPERTEDEGFLLELYATTRQEEMRLAGWDTSTQTTFIKMQFHAMRRGYASMFPGAQSSLIRYEDKPIGRIVVNHANREIRLVDLALLPDARNRGIGAGLLRTLQMEARQLRQPVVLQVLKTNRAARLYARLGFLRTGGDEMYEHLVWHPPV
jgi:ribosomal protein S18 acetylase RimI-like enzyme